MNPATAEPRPIHWAAHEYALRSGDIIAAQMGTMEVPQQRDAEPGATLTLSFVRLPAHPNASGPPIIYLAGGPGSSGIDAGKGDRWRLFDRLRRHGDVILLDQRGTGLSSAPPACSTPWQFPPGEAATEESVNTSFEASLRACAAEWRAGGVPLEAYNTSENAADVADLIRSLGDRKAVLVGISYGTFLGLAVVRDHGELVDRMILAGTEGPDHSIKLPTQADAALVALSNEIASTAAGRAQAPDLSGLVRRVFDRLATAPATTSSDGEAVTISLYDAQVVTFFLSATGANATRLPILFREMDRGDFTRMAGMVRWLRGFYGTLPAMPFATDGASPTSAARQSQAQQLEARSIFGNAVNFPSADIAGALGIPQLPARYHAPIRSDVPTLFISGTLDPRTPPANAEEVRRGFRNSHHLIVEGGGHDNDLFFASPHILDRIDAFVAGRPVGDERLEVDILRFD